jgi:hypothetical protein
MPDHGPFIGSEFDFSRAPQITDGIVGCLLIDNILDVVRR